MPTDENNKLPEEDGLLRETGAEPQQDNSGAPKRRRMRVKIRKKIRIKQKPSAKKLVRKVAERAFWVIIIVGFIASLIIMIVELDVRDEKFKQQRKKTIPIKGQ